MLRSLAVASLLATLLGRTQAQTSTGPADGNGPVHIQILTPTNGQNFPAAPAAILITASVEDTNFVHTITFLEGTNVLETLVLDPVNISNGTSATFTFDWTNVPLGRYLLTVTGSDIKGNSGVSMPVVVTVGPIVPPVVDIILPTNGQVFLAPANIQILAAAEDPDGFVETVEFFSGTNLIGIATNDPTIPIEPITAVPGPIVYPLFPFHITWSNVPPGAYTLTAIATDNLGGVGTSAPISITVATNVPPPTNVPPIVKIEIPTNGSMFYSNADIHICASTLDVDASVTQVQFFAGSNSIGIVTNYPIIVPADPETGMAQDRMFCLTWSNVQPGDYVLTAVATDSVGEMGVSAPVSIAVSTNAPPPHTNIPPVVAIVAPPDGAVFPAPADILIYAEAFDPDGFVRTVQFLENGNSIGIVTNIPTMATPVGAATANGSIVYPANPFHLLWTDVSPGQYVLTAVATDYSGAATTSAPVTITVVNPSNAPPIVTIFAADPIAVAGTNFHCYQPTAVFANYCSGTNTATFLVRRSGPDDSALVVDYDIGGSASNGVDYVALPGYISIPAGQDYALITITPLDATNISTTPIKTVILSLVPSATTTPAPPYLVGWPGKAEAVIIEDRIMPGPVTGLLPDRTFHVCMPGANGTCYSVQVSSDLVNWQAICTNMVVKGSIQFSDPETGIFGARYYQILPASGTPAY